MRPRHQTAENLSVAKLTGTRLNRFNEAAASNRGKHPVLPNIRFKTGNSFNEAAASNRGKRRGVVSAFAFGLSLQ